jgi:DNA-binding Lrp family transcriptional regulator
VCTVYVATLDCTERIAYEEGTVTERSSERREVRRVSIAEAAETLGISKDAVRMRVRRRTLRSEKINDRVYVLLNAEEHTDHDTVPYSGLGERNKELIDELRDRVRSLEETNRENRRIIAALTQRIPELEGPREQGPSPKPPQPPEVAAERASREMPSPAAGDTQEPSDLHLEQEVGDSEGTWGASTIVLAIVVVLALVGLVVFVVSLFGG